MNTYILRFTDFEIFVEFLRLDPFPNNYKGLSRETWVMHIS